MKDLYTNNETEYSKYGVQLSVVKKYIETIDKLKAANCIDELYPIKSINYERPLGNKKDFESVRINDKYRVEFKTKKCSYRHITICLIVEIVNHC